MKKTMYRNITRPVTNWKRIFAMYIKQRTDVPNTKRTSTI